ncbi:beta-glucosidase/6-phospho-beta-glucosidase/beta-galactosidase [Algoriphagus ratkowskyi]|nr:beta-glucosidase/6-phospho-beta-glucosidase/beta-galactosidase [Algoriphagus ratkowskyi]
MGGFECADHINRSGERVNLNQETQHDIRVEEDYKLLKDMGISVVREGICWSFVESTPNKYDFHEVLNRMEIAERMGIQQIWDLIHFGYPDDLYPTHPKFVERFVQLCREFARFYLSYSKQPLYVVPINEISFLSWHSGDVRGTVPFAVNSGWDIKYHLCKAAILGIQALKETDPTCRIILVEPLVEIHNNGVVDENHLVELNQHQFQAMDIIAGRMCPELGGKEDYLDILGFNYYWNCQWEAFGESLDWPDVQQIRMPLRDMLSAAYFRYKKPFFLSETGHIGSGRVEWLEEVTLECIALQEFGLPFLGICIYPVTDRPNWDDLTSYSNCGIYDLDEYRNRIPENEVINSIKKLQNLVESLIHTG